MLQVLICIKTLQQPLMLKVSMRPITVDQSLPSRRGPTMYLACSAVLDECACKSHVSPAAVLVRVVIYSSVYIGHSVYPFTCAYCIAAAVEVDETASAPG
jgi:hypothetical protein